MQKTLGFQKIQQLIVLWSLLAGLFLVLAIIITVINTLGFSINFITRSFGISFPGLTGYEDAVTLFIGVAALAMLPYCQILNGHIAVDLFIEKAPAEFKEIY